jgi:outer membrane protein TolC
LTHAGKHPSVNNVANFLAHNPDDDGADHVRPLALNWCVVLCISAAASLGPAPAQALQPLDAFLAAAQQRSPDNVEAAANLDLQAAQVDQNLGRVLPGLELRGTYTRNQYLVAPNIPLVAGQPPTPLVITPLNQLDGSGLVRVPLVDLSNFVKLSAAHLGRQGAAQRLRATALQVQASVTQAYYQLLANAALVDASQHALEVARAGLTLTQNRVAAGSAAVLDANRAAAEVERQVQQVASAQLQHALACQSLQSLSGLSPQEAAAPEALADDLAAELPLQSFEVDESGRSADSDLLPAVAAAHLQRLTFERLATAQSLTLIPALSASFMERLTNAAGFTGHNRLYLATLNLTWAYDWGTLGTLRAARAQAAAAAAQEMRMRLAAQDALHRTWHTVQANIAKSRSARAQQHVSTETAELAQDRYAAGVATQLDLLQAQRDAFAAAVTRIEADAELINARLQLRLAAGRDLLKILQEAQ